jgi:hypothetical protein
VKAKRLPVGLRTRRISGSQAAGSNVSASQSATSLLKGVRHPGSMLPVE